MIRSGNEKRGEECREREYYLFPLCKCAKKIIEKKKEQVFFLLFGC